MSAGPSISIGVAPSDGSNVGEAVAEAMGGVGRRCERTGTKGVSGVGLMVDDDAAAGDAAGGGGASFGTVGMTLLIGRFETGSLYSGCDRTRDV